MVAPSALERQQWMTQWRHAGVALAALRATETRAADLWAIADALEDAFRASLARDALPESSGLVEQQRVFGRARR